MGDLTWCNPFTGKQQKQSHPFGYLHLCRTPTMEQKQTTGDEQRSGDAVSQATAPSSAWGPKCSPKPGGTHRKSSRGRPQKAPNRRWRRAGDARKPPQWPNIAHKKAQSRPRGRPGRPRAAKRRPRAAQSLPRHSQERPKSPPEGPQQALKKR